MGGANMAISLLLLLPAVFVGGDGNSIWSKQHVGPHEFVIGASCAIETDKLTQEDSNKLHFATEDVISDACSRCWSEALRTRKERVIEECTQRFFPNIGLICNAEIDGLKTRTPSKNPWGFGPPGPPEEEAFEGCLQKYIAVNDKDELIQKNWLTESGRLWPVAPYVVLTRRDRKSKEEVDKEEKEADQVDKMHHIIKASCAVEHLEKPDRLPSCEACLMDVVEELSNKTGNVIQVIVKSQNCLKQMPKIEEACKKVIKDIPLGKIKSESYKVFACFEDYVRTADKSGKVQKETGDYMNKSIDGSLVMGMVCSMEGLSYLDSQLEDQDNQGEGFNLENDIRDCRRCFREDDFPVKSDECVEWYPDTADVPTINDRGCIDAYLGFDVDHDNAGVWSDCEARFRCDDKLRINNPDFVQDGAWAIPNLSNEGPCDVVQKRKYLRCLYDTALDRLSHQVTIRVSDYLQKLLPQLQ